MTNVEDTSSDTIDKDYLLEVYKAQWADIHHNRTQDFEIAKLILGGFLGLSGIKVFGDTPDLTITVAIIFIIICLFGILIAIRHKNLFNEKMNAIKICEKSMGLSHLELFKPPTKTFRLRTQNILILNYVLWALLFLCFALIEAYF